MSLLDASLSCRLEADTTNNPYSKLEKGKQCLCNEIIFIWVSSTFLLHNFKMSANQMFSPSALGHDMVLNVDLFYGQHLCSIAGL